MVSSLPPSRCPDWASFTHPSVLGTGNCSVPPFPWGLPERLEYFLFWLVWTGTWHSCDPKDSIWVLLVTWKDGVPFGGGDIVGFTWLSCWNIQPPKHWPRSSLPPMFWFSVITKALWFQSPLISSVLFTLWGSLKTSRFCPNTRSRFHGTLTLVYLMGVVGAGMVAVLMAVWACFALLWARMLEFFVIEYILRRESVTTSSTSGKSMKFCLLHRRYCSAVVREVCSLGPRGEPCALMATILYIWECVSLVERLQGEW